MDNIIKLKVFISHASEDNVAAKRLAKRLKEDGFDPWLDLERLLPGQDWNLEIEQAIRGSDATLLCFSDVSVKKEGYIQREYKRAMKYFEEKPMGTIFVIPIRLDDCEMPHFIRDLQWVDYPKDYDRLVKALEIRLGDNLVAKKSKPKKDVVKKKNSAPRKAGGTVFNIQGDIKIGRDFVSGNQVNYITNTAVNKSISPAEFLAELQKLISEIQVLKSQPEVESTIKNNLSAVESNLKDAIDEASKEKPVAERIKATLDSAKEIMDKLGGGVASAINLGTVLGNLALITLKIFGR